MKTNNNLTAYNEAVKTAFFAILETTNGLLATVKRHELRCCLIRENRDNIIYQMVNPLLYVCLEADSSKYCIRYGFQHFDRASEYSRITASFTRSIYKLTSKDVTSIDIEQCIATEWLITNCDEMFTYMEEHNQHHSHKLIAYKPEAKQKKRQLRVA